MSITNPTQLVAEFKKSGEFDRLRRDLLTQFKNGESISTFMARVEDIIQQRISSDAKLRVMGPDAMHAELMQEMDRYPLVERTVAELPALSDPSFHAGIRKSIAGLLRGDRNAGPNDKGNPDVGREESASSDSEGSDLEKADGSEEKSRSRALKGDGVKVNGGITSGDYRSTGAPTRDAALASPDIRPLPRPSNADREKTEGVGPQNQINGVHEIEKTEEAMQRSRSSHSMDIDG